MSSGIKARCPSCDAEIAPSALKRHQGSEICTVLARSFALRRRGLRECGESAALMRAIGAAESHPTRYLSGGPGRRAKVETQTWAPATTLALHELIVATARNDGAGMLPASYRKRALAALQSDPLGTQLLVSDGDATRRTEALRALLAHHGVPMPLP